MVPLLFGLSGDIDETIMDTIRFSEELDLDHIVIHPVQMYPGTGMGRKNIDWLNFLVEEEFLEDVGKQTGFAGFHPCVLT
jgi:radical SAM superfamily enzyme